MAIDALHIDLNSAMLRPETIRAMLRAAAEIAAAHPGAAPDSFAGILLEGAALKCALVRALEGAAGAAPPLPGEELACLRARTAAYYGREMTTGTASVAAAIVWDDFRS